MIDIQEVVNKCLRKLSDAESENSKWKLHKKILNLLLDECLRTGKAFADLEFKLSNGTQEIVTEYYEKLSRARSDTSKWKWYKKIQNLLLYEHLRTGEGFSSLKRKYGLPDNF